MGLGYIEMLYNCQRYLVLEFFLKKIIFQY